MYSEERWISKKSKFFGHVEKVGQARTNFRTNYRFVFFTCRSLYLQVTLSTLSVVHLPRADHRGIKFDYTENKEPFLSNPSTWITVCASMNEYYSPDTHRYLRLAEQIHGDRVQFVWVSGSCWAIRVCAGAVVKGLFAINPLTPNDHYRGRTAPLTSKHCILYIYSTNISTEYFKHGGYTLRFFPSKCSLFHNSNLFRSCIIHILYTGWAKIKKIIPAPKG
jgi:hypothetical protein